MPMLESQSNRNVASRFLLSLTVALFSCVAFLLPSPLLAQTSAPGPAITPEQQQGIDKDIARHFGDAPANPGPKARLSGSLKPADVHAAMRKVADWELGWSQPYFDRIWTWSVLYSGFMATSQALDDAKYRDAMQGMAEKFHWELRSAVPNADDQSVGQTYLELDLLQPAAEKIDPTREALDGLLAGAAPKIPSNQAKIPWWWCDALFMAPPVWSRMYAATHETKYLAYLDQHWWETSRLLYDPQHHLYFRDITFLHKTDERGHPIFWSRGNGWVIAGLAEVLNAMPNDYPSRPKYLEQFRQMAEKLKSIQGTDGLWQPGLLGSYPLPEISGSAFFVYAMAWGINHGVLDRREYLPVVRRGWAGLLTHVYVDGRLGSIQPIGGGPDTYKPQTSYVFGVGAFLMAGSEMRELAEHKR